MEDQEARSRRIKAAVASAAALAAGFEGLRQYAYYDPVGILTVCYGSTTSVQKGKKYGLDECKARLDADMLQAISIVDTCVPNLPGNVLVAFGDAVYNMGPKIACSTEKSTAARLLKTGKYEAACQQLPKWNKAAGIPLPGLTKRRAKEMEVCLDFQQ